jgi:hypothetical protein
MNDDERDAVDLGAVEGIRLKGRDNNGIVKIWDWGLSGLIFPLFTSQGYGMVSLFLLFERI